MFKILYILQQFVGVHKLKKFWACKETAVSKTLQKHSEWQGFQPIKYETQGTHCRDSANTKEQV